MKTNTLYGYMLCAMYLCCFVIQQPLAQSEVQLEQISILYTGKSLGVLGNTRFQDEHELITEQANRQDLSFKLVSHACWKAKGITVFFPSDEPVGDELSRVLAQKEAWNDNGKVDAILSNDGLIFQDINRRKLDMMEMMRSNKRTDQDFPDFQNTSVQLYSTILGVDSIKCIIVAEAEAIWPLDHRHWEIGEVNRIDLGKTSRLFELPFNKGSYSSRSTVLKDLINSPNINHSFIQVDMGHRHGDFDVEAVECTKVDFEGLNALNYQIVVPYQQELIIGSAALKSISTQYPNITVLSSNIESDESGLFQKYTVVEYENFSIGFIGLSDPELELEMPSSLLEHYKFIPVDRAAKSAVNSLRKQHVDIVIALSNMSAAQNAILGDKVNGIDFILADFSTSNIVHENAIELKEIRHTLSRPGNPHLIARNNDFGIAIGRLDLILDNRGDGVSLTAAKHRLYPVTDRVQGDTSLTLRLKKDLHLIKRPKGELLFPAFVDIIEQAPVLKNFDETTQNGRVSKALWEDFLARLVRTGAPAEVSILRRVPSFLPQIGKLHEREIRSWLWMEDDIVMMDVLGKDLVRFLEIEVDEHYVTSGLKSFLFKGRRFWLVMGRFLVPNAYYRLATTNVIRDEAAKEYFAQGIRSDATFDIQDDGTLKSNKKAPTIKLRDYVIKELQTIRAQGKGKIHHKNIAQLLLPDSKFEKLTTFNFERPTLWSSINRSNRSTGYESVPESRILSNNSFVLGINGGLNVLVDKNKSSWELGFNFAFAEQSADQNDGSKQVTENADDFKTGLTYRLKGKKKKALHPFLRAEYDSEFTPTINTATRIANPLQQVGRGIIGLSKIPGATWRRFELGFTAENDFSNQRGQLGIQGRTLGRFPLNQNYTVIYSLRNDFNFFFSSPNDTERDLSYKYNMVHELLVPLFGDISLSVSADLFFYKGKVAINNKPGNNVLMKVGITYDRLWKPRFQSLF